MLDWDWSWELGVEVEGCWLRLWASEMREGITRSGLMLKLG